MTRLIREACSASKMLQGPRDLQSTFAIDVGQHRSSTLGFDFIAQLIGRGIVIQVSQLLNARHILNVQIEWICTGIKSLIILCLLLLLEILQRIIDCNSTNYASYIILQVLFGYIVVREA